MKRIVSALGAGLLISGLAVVAAPAQAADGFVFAVGTTAEVVPTTSGYRVQETDPQGHTRVVPTSGSPRDVELGPDGALYVAVADATHNEIQVLSPTNQVLRTLKRVEDPRDEIGSTFTSIAVGDDGTVYAGTFGRGIVSFAPGSTVQEALPGVASSLEQDSLAVDSTGVLYASEISYLDPRDVQSALVRYAVDGTRSDLGPATAGSLVVSGDHLYGLRRPTGQPSYVALIDTTTGAQTRTAIPVSALRATYGRAALPTTGVSALTLVTTPLVRAPGKATISGRLTGPDGAGVAVAPVRITYHPESSDDVRTIRTVLTGPDGRFSTQAQPTFHSVLRASYAGSAALDAAASAEATTKVQLSAPLASFPTTISPGTSVAFRGALAPGTVGPRVTLQWLRPDGRVVALTGPQPVLRNGAFAFSRAFPHSGTFRLRFLGLESSRYYGSASRVVTLRVVSA